MFRKRHPCAGSVGDIRGRHGKRRGKPLRIHGQMPFDARYPLTRVIPLLFGRIRILLALGINDHVGHLAAANDYDGRGNLSLDGLTGYCRFLLETCIDQARFMGELLATDNLHKRIEAYVRLRAAGILPEDP